MEEPALDPTRPCPPPNPSAAWAPPAPPKRRLGCLAGVLGGCLLSALLVGAVIVSIPLGLAAIAAHAGDALEEIDLPQGARHALLRGEAGENARGVLRLSLRGVITGLPPNRWYSPEDCDAAVLEAIEAVIADDDFDAILLDVSSPGGGVTPSDALYHALERFKAAKEGRRVIVLGGDLVASGAYYLAMQADWIRLRPTTLVGSIGVIVPGLNAAGLAQKLGIADNSVASGASKDLGNPLKPVNPEHNAILKTVVDALYERFVALVAKGRALPEADVRRLADGRVFSARDAVNLRLADDIGYEDTLDAKIAELLGCSEGDLAVYGPRRAGGTFRAVLGELPGALGQGVGQALLGAPPAAPQYLHR